MFVRAGKRKLMVWQKQFSTSIPSFGGKGKANLSLIFCLMDERCDGNNIFRNLKWYVSLGLCIHFSMNFPFLPHFSSYSFHAIFHPNRRTHTKWKATDMMIDGDCWSMHMIIFLQLSQIACRVCKFTNILDVKYLFWRSIYPKKIIKFLQTLH